MARPTSCLSSSSSLTLNNRFCFIFPASTPFTLLQPCVTPVNLWKKPFVASCSLDYSLPNQLMATSKLPQTHLSSRSSLAVIKVCVPLPCFVTVPSPGCCCCLSLPNHHSLNSGPSAADTQQSPGLKGPEAALITQTHTCIYAHMHLSRST